MAFTKKYKTLGEVLLAYKLHHVKETFKITVKKAAPRRFAKDLAFDMKEIPFDSSEATIREVIIFPVLKEAWKSYTNCLTLWGHKAIYANEELNGTPDYVISKRSLLSNIVFEAPFIAVVEAKMDDFTGGWAQCALEMLAVQKVNQTPELPVFGMVTNGEVWQFAQLKDSLFTEFSEIFILRNLNELFSVLTTIFEFYKNYFAKNPK
ncbi:MAG: hypothetical protein RIS64_1184 [Bacteroidota bacterium]|jgi:hypothetical protein